MIYSVHQPHYLPYPGYLSKVDESDQFVFLEKVQFVKREFQNRNLVKGPDGVKWLTVPVKGEYRASIDQMKPDYSAPWQRKHESTLRRFYGRAAHLEELDGFIRVLEQEYETLAELLINTSSFFLDRFGINAECHRQADLEPLPEEPNRRIIEIGKRLGADIYLAGAGGRNYMDLKAFVDAGIEVRFQDNHPSEYPQLHGEFIPNLGAIDLLLCAGPEGFSRFFRAG